MANTAPATAPTIVNPVDSFFDDYKTAVEADKARRPKPRPRVAPPAQQPPQMNAPARKSAMEDTAIHYTEKYGADTAQQILSPEPQQESGWASRLSGEFGKAQQPTAVAAAPHVKAFEGAVAPKAPVKLPSFISAEKKPMNPKLDSVLASMDGDRLETMGQEFASTYFKDGGAGGYKDDELQQVYLGVQEHLRDRVKKGYKLKTMDEARLFEED
jgi:hypothetical protein